jgi:hypothetical protein
MKHLYFITIVSFVIITVGCSGKDEEVKTESSSLNTPVNTAKTDAPVSNSNVSVNPATNKTSPGTIPITINPQTVSTSATGLNPAHGQPGHRCDIAVGAPLNSAPNPGSATTPTLTSNQAPANMAPSIVNTSPKINTTPIKQTVAAGMNPAHGQPGHRCDIAVGAPLSTPMNPNYTPPSANTNSPQSLTPSISNTTPKINTAPSQPVAAGMNPAHGQPGHRCDIAVGAPLNSPVNPTTATPATKQESPGKKN